MAKTRIIDTLGEKGLLLPALLNAAIAANERAKYVLALLQLAAANADCPSPEAPTLRAEREACGIAKAQFDRVIERSEALGPGIYHIPEAASLIALLTDALDAMLAPVALVGGETPSGHELAARMKGLVQGIPPIDGDVLTGETIAALTSGRPATGDGIHLLVMALHKELNRLQRLVAEEDIDGAKAYGLSEADRPLVAAFMAGLRRTSFLKFDHPGLDTTAARSGDTLLIQNDIGETDAHVLVIRVGGLAVSLTYSDVHTQRLRFFQDILADAGLNWDETRSRRTAGLAEDDLFYLVTGTLQAADEEKLKAFLDRLGSRIVFLIDWNRARKRLGLFVPNALAVEVLGWAAERDLGHRAFLQLGGERLIYDALEQAVRTPLRYGEKLHETIGLDAAGEYLRFVLETAAMGLRDARSPMLIRDRIRGELFSHFRSAEQRLFAEIGRHAAIIRRLTAEFCNALRTGRRTGAPELVRNAEHAKGLESNADDIVRTIRSTVQRIPGTEIFRRIVEISDDAADEIEDAAYLAAVAIEAGGEGLVPPSLLDLAQLVNDGAKSFQLAIETAPLVRRGGGREPMQNFLEAADRVVTAEHQTDVKERDVTAALMAAPLDCRQLYLTSAIARHLEASADALLRASLTLRDHILGEVMFE